MSSRGEIALLTVHAVILFSPLLMLIVEGWLLSLLNSLIWHVSVLLLIYYMYLLSIYYAGKLARKFKLLDENMIAILVIDLIYVIMIAPVPVGFHVIEDLTKLSNPISLLGTLALSVALGIPLGLLIKKLEKLARN